MKIKSTPSSHFDERPECVISLLVIHNISLPPNQFGNDNIRDFFTGKLNPNAHPFFAHIADMRVSSHAVIYRTGEIEQFVDFNNRAWHAGVSSFQGVSRCNDYSIGIELEGSDTQPYTRQQYASLIEVSLLIMQQYPAISLGRIVGHNDIAPGRKSDPGPSFDWCYFRQHLLARWSNQ